MIYVVLNNNYHVFDLMSHLEDRPKNIDLQFLVVAHTLERDRLDSLSEIADVIEIPRFRFRGGYIQQILEIRKSKSTIDIHFNEVSENDRLILYTDLEFMNILIASAFVRAGAKVFIMTEGIATYSDIAHGRCRDWVAAIRGRLFKTLTGLSECSYYYMRSGKLKQGLSASVVNGIFTYYKIAEPKCTKTIHISQGVYRDKGLELNENAVVFLNSPLYEQLCSWDMHIEAISEVLGALSRRFSQIYFKFHPRETNEAINYQKKTLNAWECVFVDDSSEPIEWYIAKLKTKYAAALVSTALLNLVPDGIVPIYCQKYAPVLGNALPLIRFGQTLEAMGYFLPDDARRISSDTVGFDQEMLQPSGNLWDWL